MRKLFNLLFSVAFIVTAFADEAATTVTPELLSYDYGTTHRSGTVIRAVIRRYLRGIENEYVAALEQEPGLPGGKITVRLTIKADGFLKDVGLIEDTVGCPPFSASIAERVGTWRFPPVSSDEETVVYPFVFIRPDVPTEDAEPAAGAAADSDPFREEAEAEREPSPSTGEYVFEPVVTESRLERPAAFILKRRKPAWAYDEDELTQFDEGTRTFLVDAAAFLAEAASDPAASLLPERADRYGELREVEAQERLLALADERLALGTAETADLLPGPAGKETKAARKHYKAIEKLEAREGKYRKKIDGVNERIDRVRREGAAAREGRRDELIRAGERLMDAGFAGYGGCWVLLVLGELYFERSTAAHVGAIREFRGRLTAARAEGEVLKEYEPEPDFELTIAAYQHIALNYKDFALADAAYYTLAYCLYVEDEYEEAARTFYKLTQLYPDSEYVAEAYFRVGEYFFDQYEFDKAVKYYTVVPPTDPSFGAAARYKRAGSFYNTGDLDDEVRTEYLMAIDDFTSYLDLYGPEAPLSREAQDFAAFALYEWAYPVTDRPAAEAGVALFDEEFRGDRERDYSAAVLHTLADVYYGKEDWEGAATAYEALLRAYPEYDETPRALASLAACYSKDEENFDAAHEARLRLVEEYAPASRWYEGQTDPDRRHRALKRWEDALYEVAVYNHVKGERKCRVGDDEAESFYRNAIDYSKQYLAAFPANPKAYHVNFYLAEAYFEVDDFAAAAVAYEGAGFDYTDRERYKLDEWDEKFTQEQALFNAIIARDEIFQKGIEESAAEPEAEASPGDELGRPFTANEAELVRVCDLFIERYPESRDAPTALSKLGEVYSYVEDYERAREVYGRVLEDYAAAPDPDYQEEHDQIYVNAVESTAKSYFNEAEFYEEAGAFEKARRRYELAREWYAKTEHLAEGRNVRDTLERARGLAALTSLMAAEMRGAGVQLEEAGEAPLSVTRYDFVEIYPPLPPIKTSAVEAKRAEAEGYAATVAAYGADNADIERLALERAADTYYEARDWRNASRAYLNLIEAYESYRWFDDNRELREAYEKAAEGFERRADWAGAAEVYLIVAAHPEFKGTGLGRDCLFRAGMMYEQLDDWPKAAETFDRFWAEYYQVSKPLLEATYRLARAEEKLGLWDDALGHYRDVVAIYKASVREGLDVAGTERFVAVSHFEFTDAKFGEYEAIKFVMPQAVMEANLQKKVNQSYDLVTDYTEISKLGIPKWSVAARCRLGDVYYEFAEALLGCEIPRELLPEYWKALPESDERKPLLEEAYYTFTSALEEQAVPLKEKAAAEYEEAVTIAEAGGLETPWSRKARERLSALESVE